jgi:hypothetical protein
MGQKCFANEIIKLLQLFYCIKVLFLNIPGQCSIKIRS